MNYKEFQEELLQKVTEKLDSHTTIAITQSSGNNGVLRSELEFKTPQSKSTGTVSLEGYYQAFLEGMELSQIVKEIVNLPEQLQVNAKRMTDDLSDFNQIKDRIIFKLVNAKKNAERLADMPHLPFFDLSIVYSVVFNVSLSGVASLPIHNLHLRHWKKDTATLHACAIKNGLRIFPPTLEPMSSIIRESSPDIEDEYDLDPAYVLSNKELHWGATSILYEQVLKDIGDFLQMNYFVAPSSIHETIIYPEFIGMSKEELDVTIQFVNRTNVRPEEILSDHAYYYDRKQGRLVLP